MNWELLVLLALAGFAAGVCGRYLYRLHRARRGDPEGGAWKR